MRTNVAIPAVRRYRHTALQSTCGTWHSSLRAKRLGVDQFVANGDHFDSLAGLDSTCECVDLFAVGTADEPLEVRPCHCGFRIEASIADDAKESITVASGDFHKRPSY